MFDNYDGMTPEEILSVWAVDARPHNVKLRDLNQRVLDAREEARNTAVAEGGLSFAEIKEREDAAAAPFQAELDAMEAESENVSLKDLGVD